MTDINKKYRKKYTEIGEFLFQDSFIWWPLELQRSLLDPIRVMEYSVLRKDTDNASFGQDRRELSLLCKYVNKINLCLRI